MSVIAGVRKLIGEDMRNSDTESNPMGIIDTLRGEKYAVSYQCGWYYVLQHRGKFWDIISTPLHTYEEALDMAFDLCDL